MRPLRRRVTAAGALAVAILLLRPAPVSPQAPPKPTFPAQAEMVTVDVVVTGRGGEPVLDLTREDFTVTEDGVPQPVLAFEAVHRPGVPAIAPALAVKPTIEPPVSTNRREPGREPASFVIVFDELHLEPAEAVRARKAVAEFLDASVAPGDRVALVGTKEGTRWTARMPDGRETLLQVLERLQGRKVGESVKDAMTDYEAMRIDQDRDPVVLDQVMRRLVSTGYIHKESTLQGERYDETQYIDSWRSQTQARAAQVWGRAAAQIEQTLGVVDRALLALAGTPGRKSLLLVTGGLVRNPKMPAYRRVVTDSMRANAPVYALDAAGLVAAGPSLQAEVTEALRTQDMSMGAGITDARDRGEGSDALALDTGGIVARGNDLAGALDRIGRDARSYYLLGYAPAARAADGRFRSIEVKVAREGVRVRARRGYFAPGRDDKPAKADARDAGIQRALDAPFDLPEVPLRALARVFGEAEPGKALVVLTAEADVRGLAFAEKDGVSKDALETLVLVARRDTGEFTRFDQQYEMSFKPETRARMEETGFPITRDLKLAPGAYQAKVVARDRNGGKVGSVTHDFDVPDLGGLRVSSLVLSDRVHEGDAGSRTPALTASRTFLPVGLLHSRFEVYGAAKDAATGRPAVTAGLAVRRGDGRVQFAMPETPLQAGPDGALARTVGTPLDGLPPGTYEVVVVVTDLVAGRTAEARDAFVVERAPGR